VVNDLDRYLLPTETPEVLVRRHWASVARAAAIFMAVEAAGLFTITRLSGSQFLAIVGVSLVIGGLLYFAWALGDWYVERFVITDRRVLLINGLLTKRVAIMPLSKVTDLTYERSIPGRILGYGVFVMESAGQKQGLDRVDFLPTPDVLYQQVSTLLFGPNSRIGGGYFGGGPGGPGAPGSPGGPRGFGASVSDPPGPGGRRGQPARRGDADPDQATTPLPRR
jgi:PH (Pleckstrin Homology) domain-containing protein